MNTFCLKKAVRKLTQLIHLLAAMVMLLSAAEWTRAAVVLESPDRYVLAIGNNTNHTNENQLVGTFNDSQTVGNPASTSVATMASNITYNNGLLQLTGSGSGATGVISVSPASYAASAFARVIFTVVGNAEPVSLNVTLAGDGALGDQNTNLDNTAYVALQNNAGNYIYFADQANSGTQSASYDALLPIGRYTLTVAANSVGSTVGMTAGVISAIGSASFSNLDFAVAPEPAHLSLLAIVALAGARRRKA